jgi:hypothetical protein
MLKSSAEDYVSQIQVGSQIAVRVKPTHPETSVVAGCPRAPSQQLLANAFSSSSVLDGAPSFRVGRPAVAPYRPWFAFLPCGLPVLISVWNGMGKCNRADCNHHVSFRTWHFLCKRRRLSEARRRAGIPGRNSRLGLATSPGSGALLSCNHRSNAGSIWLLNIAQEGFFELESLSCLLFSKLCNCEQTRKARPS